MEIDYLQTLIALLPEILVLAGALGALAAGVATDRKGAGASPLPEAVALVGLALAAVAVVFIPVEGRLLGDMLVLDPLSRLFKLILLAMSVPAVLLARGRALEGNHGEYLAVLLLATIGLMLAASADELLVIFLSLELASLSFYILVSFRRSTPESSEAALKYFLFGGISASFLLFGISLLYGFAGTTSLRGVADALTGTSPEPFAVAGIIMVLGGFGFKVAAAPFHPWAPDVYQAGPVSSVTMIASSSKVASFLVAVKVTAIGFAGWEGSAAWGDFAAGWIPLLAVLAAVSLVLGNLTALVQRSVRRLIAYSAVAHAGYILIGLTAGSADGAAAVMFYAVQYAITSIGIFGVIYLVERHRGGDTFTHFAGLGRSDPFIGMCLLLFVVSLAGIPPLAGFFGKFYLFTSALTSAPAGEGGGLVWLVALAIAMNAVSLYYYLGILKAVFLTEPPETKIEKPPHRSARGLVAVMAGLVLLLGVLPGILVSPIGAAVAGLFPG